jgi:prepilin-type N-terminal cleavage/methylation domain-containing protein
MKRGMGNGNRESGSIKKTIHCPLPATHCVKQGFTLVELLVVLLLMGMIYAIAFNSFMPTSAKESAKRPTLLSVANVFRDSPLYRHSEMILYGLRNGDCLLVSDEKIVRRFHLSESGTGYRLNPDETLQEIDYPHVKVEREEFIPLFTLRCRADGYLDPQILLSGDTWIYLHPYLPPKKFENPSAMVAFIRQSDYLPDKAGYAQ